MSRGRIVSSQSLKNNKNSLLKVQILVVDYDSISLAIVSSMLRTCSLQDNQIELSVITVKSGLEALSTIQASKTGFDLVITELHIHGMNGWELQKQIDENFKIPVIIMSLDDNESVIAKSLESGALIHIVKPVKQQDLKNIWQCAVAIKKGKSVINNISEENMKKNNENNNNNNNNNNKNKNKNVVVDEEEGIGSSNDQEVVSSASSVNEGENGQKRKYNKSKKRARDDQGDDEDVVAPKKAKVVWTNSLHNRFLQAINHIGLEKAVPKRILEFMNVPGLTRENVASHLQKYRMFLKKVAERGLWSSQAMSERILRSSFATGYNSNLINKTNFQFPQQPLSAFQQGHRGNFSAGFNNFLSRFPNNNSHEASSSNSPPPQLLFRNGQSSLLNGATFNNLNLQRPNLFGDNSTTGLFYQPNQNRYGMQMQSNNVAGMNGFTTPTTPPPPQMPMFQQQNQQLFGSNFGNPSSQLINFQSAGSNYASTSTAANNNLGTTTTNNFLIPSLNPNNSTTTNYAGIRLNINGEIGTGLNLGFGTNSNMDWINNNNTSTENATNNALTGGNNGPMLGGDYLLPNNNQGGGGFSNSSAPQFGNSLLGSQGGSSSSSSLFGSGNQLDPMIMPFTVGNQESNTLTSLFTPNSTNNAGGLENSGANYNDFAFNLLNDVVDDHPDGGSSNNEEEELQESDLELFFNGALSLNSTTPFDQQQGVEGAMNIESPYQPEIDTNDFLNVEFSNSCTIFDNPNWNDQSSGQDTAENVNLGSDGNSTDGYFSGFDQPQGSLSLDEPMNPQFNVDMHQETGTSHENDEGWEEDILNILLGNNNY